MAASATAHTAVAMAAAAAVAFALAGVFTSLKKPRHLGGVSVIADLGFVY